MAGSASCVVMVVAVTVPILKSANAIRKVVSLSAVYTTLSIIALAVGNFANFLTFPIN